MGTYIIRNFFKEDLIVKFYKLQISKYAGVAQTVVFKPRDANEREKAAMNLKHGKKYAIIKLEELLGIRKHAALEIAVKYKKLWEVSGKDMHINYEICKLNNMDLATCIKYPELLAQKDLTDKIDIIKKLPEDINILAPLAIMDKSELKKLLNDEVKKSMFQLRVNIFKQLLGMKNEAIYNALVTRPFLRNLNLQRFEDNVTILLKNGVTSDEIIKDWWVLRYNPKTIQQRIDIALENNVEKIKTWMVRSQENIFDVYIKRRSENKLILGDNTLVEYLSERLDCSTEHAKGLMVKLPALKNKSMKKMQQIIDFLYAEGFQPFHICRVPKILLHSVETTRKRIRELEKQGMKMDSLHMLTKSQRQYMPYYEALVKSNKNKIKNKSGA